MLRKFLAINSSIILAGLSAWSQPVTTTPVSEEVSTQALTCDKLPYRTLNINGEKIERPVVAKPEHLKCLPPMPLTQWTVVHETWSPEHEQKYSEFIRGIGQANCNSIDTCLIDPNINPYRDVIDLQAFHYTDCADFPYYLRAYFAYKMQLPFSFGMELEANPFSEDQLTRIENDRKKAIENGKLEEFESKLKDTRYSRNGNSFKTRFNAPSSGGSARYFFSDNEREKPATSSVIHNQISSGSMRMLSTPDGKPMADFYSPRLEPGSIRPGTVVYRPDGHVAMVYDVTPEGKILLIDSHPDNSLSRKTFDAGFWNNSTSNPVQGWGFKNWRPFKLMDVKRSKDGIITKARFQFARDEEIEDYSLDQYYGNLPNQIQDWKKRDRFIADGRYVDWFDFLNFKMSNGTYSLDPLVEFQTSLTNICSSLQRRVDSVNKALAEGLDKAKHPEKLPTNIFATEGDWESFSTPASDLNIRNQVLVTIQNLKNYMRKYVNQDPRLSYRGSNLKQDLIKKYAQVNASCRFSYQNSKGQVVPLDMTSALKRSTIKAFDPYLCPELRWGATKPAELKSCLNEDEKREWYRLQQFLRNSNERDPNAVMGWSLEEMYQMDVTGKVDNKEQSNKYDIVKALGEL